MSPYKCPVTACKWNREGNCPYHLLHATCQRLKDHNTAASFRAGWEASMDFATGGTSNLEQALQQHFNPTTTTDL